MRGCLTFLVLLVTVAAIAGWFLLPVAAGVLIGDRIQETGFRGTGTQITVEADPPLALATLHADRIHVTSTQAQFNGLFIGTVDVTASDVNLLERTAVSIKGAFTNLRLTSGTGTWTVSSATVSGSGSDARVTLRLDAEDASLMAAAAVERRIDERPTGVTLIAPDRIRFVAGGTTVGGRLVAEDGGRLVFEPGDAAGSLLGSIDLLIPGPDVPLRVTSVDVTPDGITLVGAIDASFIPH